MEQKLKDQLWGRIETALRFDGEGIPLDRARTAFLARVEDETWNTANPYPVDGTVSARLSWIQFVTLGIIAEVTGVAVELNREPIPTADRFEDAGAAHARPPPSVG